MDETLKIFSPVAVRALMNRLAPRLDAVSGKPIEVATHLNPDIAERIAAGERFDVGLTNPHFVQALVASGRIDGASHRPFGPVPLAVGCREGTASPAVTSGSDIVALVTDATSIGYTGAGTSGHTYLEVMERLGLSRAALPKSRPMGAGGLIAAVACSEVEFCVVPLTTVLSAPGVVLAAVFPSEVGASIDISVFLSPAPATSAAAILEFLTSTEIDHELAAAGLIRFAFDSAMTWSCDAMAGRHCLTWRQYPHSRRSGPRAPSQLSARASSCGGPVHEGATRGQSDRAGKGLFPGGAVFFLRPGNASY